MARSRTLVRGVLAASVVGAAVAALPATGSAATVDVHVGDFTPKYAAVHTAFYPSRVVIKRGDKVKFHFKGFDTVTFVARGGKLPDLIVPAGGTNPLTKDSAGNPYWWSDTTPVLGINPVAAGPSNTTSVTGRALVNSGLPGEGVKSFTATFPRAGTFVVRSIVHPRMRATVVVLPTSSKAKGQTKKQIAALAARQKKTDVAAAKLLAAKRAPKGTVLVGPGNNNVAIFGYSPAKATVKAGSSLTFRMADATRTTRSPSAPRPS
jgi:plastocyanin